MLYYLFDWLHKLNFPGAGMFGYTSFRALMAIILALLISSIWGDKFIKLLKRKQITETQRDAKIDPFGVNKVGVPSMGGVPRSAVVSDRRRKLNYGKEYAAYRKALQGPGHFSCGHGLCKEEYHPQLQRQCPQEAV